MSVIIFITVWMLIGAIATWILSRTTHIVGADTWLGFTIWCLFAPIIGTIALVFWVLLLNPISKDIEDGL